MSSSYTIVTGDTFETISRKVYGVENHADLIRDANPGLADPLPLNFVIVIPDNPNDPKDRNRFLGAASPDELVLEINNERYRFWEKISITRSIDAIDQISVTAPFEPDNDLFRQSFVPFSYNPVRMGVGDEPVFTGTMVAVKPSMTTDKRIVTASCYSLPGVLADCTASSNSWPLEFAQGTTLRTIVERLCRPFGIGVDFFDVPDFTLSKSVSLNVGKKVLEFIVDLARQFDLVVASSPDGNLLFRRSNQDIFPQAEFVEGERPLINVVPNFNEQNYYSHITGLQPEFIGIPGARYTRANPHLRGVSRPFTFGIPDSDGGDIKTTVDGKMGRMFANAISYNVTIPTWRNPRGVLWGPNTFVALDYPSAMIYGRYEFLIRKVVFEAEGNSRVANLELVLPGVFNGRLPERLPWQE